MQKVQVTGLNVGGGVLFVQEFTVSLKDSREFGGFAQAYRDSDSWPKKSVIGSNV
jgi:hypothetical protein